MPLHHLLYRCPECGHDPVRSEEDGGASCAGCGAGFVRAEGASIEIRSTDADLRRATPCELVDRIRRWEADHPTTRDAAGRLAYRADVLFRRAGGMQTVRDRGRVLGFFEAFDQAAPATLAIETERLRLEPAGSDGFDWPWTSIRAVQTSSKSLQLNVAGDGLFDVRFVHDSPRRWEELLHVALREHYGREGKQVLEFQPRIVTR